jgi:hypothetical protein
LGPICAVKTMHRPFFVAEKRSHSLSPIWNVKSI